MVSEPAVPDWGSTQDVDKNYLPLAHEKEVIKPDWDATGEERGGNRRESLGTYRDSPGLQFQGFHRLL